MTHFRKRLGADAVAQVNEWILSGDKEADAKDHDDDSGAGNGPPHTDNRDGTDDTPQHSQLQSLNQGKLLLDATCAPADIAYPTDLSLLSDARERLEHMIDILHEPDQGERMKPRTYRNKARRSYLVVAKQRRVNANGLRKAIGQQLRFVARNLRIIANYKEQDRLPLLSRQQYRQLLVIHELYRQQQEMYVKRIHHIEDRIVSMAQPHVRPIVRGKTRAKVEFGAKVAVSVVDGYARLERLARWSTFRVLARGW